MCPCDDQVVQCLVQCTIMTGNKDTAYGGKVYSIAIPSFSHLPVVSAPVSCSALLLIVVWQP